jgi:hypothetical protein
MKKTWQRGGLVMLGAVVAVAAMMFFSTDRTPTSRAADDSKSTAGPRYTVIETQGFNLLVTDNATNRLYFYATDKDVPVGSPLKLRASLDLSQVGKKELTIKAVNLENYRKKETKETKDSKETDK